MKKLYIYGACSLILLACVGLSVLGFARYQQKQSRQLVLREALALANSVDAGVTQAAYAKQLADAYTVFQMHASELNNTHAAQEFDQAFRCYRDAQVFWLAVNQGHSIQPDGDLARMLRDGYQLALWDGQNDISSQPNFERITSALWSNARSHLQKAQTLLE